MASSSGLIKRARSPQSAAVAGIAFLWFIGVIRFRLGALEDKLFATVFLGSGLLFICMLFAAGAVMGTLLTLSAQPAGASDGIARMSGALTSALLATFGTRWRRCSSHHLESSSFSSSSPRRS